jgi:hypothetical protein
MPPEKIKKTKSQHKIMFNKKEKQCHIKLRDTIVSCHGRISLCSTPRLHIILELWINDLETATKISLSEPILIKFDGMDSFFESILIRSHNKYIKSIPRISSLKFHYDRYALINYGSARIMNFPHFLVPTQSNSFQKAVLEDDRWRIDLYPLPGLRQTVSELREYGGYSDTHQISFSHKNGNFSRDELEILLSKVHIFVCFVCGR